MALILSLGGTVRGISKFKASLVFLVSSRPARERPCLKKGKERERRKAGVGTESGSLHNG